MTLHDPTSYSDLSQGRIRHIDFHIQADFSTNTLAVKATYQLDAPRRGPLFLDTFKIDIKKAHASGRALTWEYDTSHETLGSRLHLKGLDGDTSFTLEFVTSPEASALQWLTAAQTLGGGHPFLYSQCQATHARSVFPCQDTPSVRFTYSAEVEAPKGLTVVMAAEQAEGREGSGRFVFRMPQPIPSYLFALAVGHLEFREFGPRTGVYAEPEILEAAAWEFAENEMRVNEAEKLLGPYLWGRFDLLVLPPSFPFGGMENPRLTFLTPTAILGTRGQTYLITHELAHAWTGNLVTNATWQDFWLNEGWTTYAETRITEVLEGKDFNELNLVFHSRELMEAMERLGYDSPHTCLKRTDAEEEARAFNIPYYKGCFFLQECERAVGRVRFDAFIQSYMRRFQFQSITTETFLDFMKVELPEVFSKVDVNQWVYKPGMPESWQKPQSKLYDEVQAALNAYQKDGTLPTPAQVEHWHGVQVKSFLQGLPATVPAADCPRIEEALDLRKRNDAAHYSFFYALCIASRYEAILPRVEAYAEKVGRMLYIMPVFRALVTAEWSRPHARPLFERVKPRHHLITAGGIERVLSAAGL